MGVNKKKSLNPTVHEDVQEEAGCMLLGGKGEVDSPLHIQLRTLKSQAKIIGVKELETSESVAEECKQSGLKIMEVYLNCSDIIFCFDCS